ncbi:hypothetical protein [Flexivirga sp. B27]
MSIITTPGQDDTGVPDVRLLAACDHGLVLPSFGFVPFEPLEPFPLLLLPLPGLVEGLLGIATDGAGPDTVTRFVIACSVANAPAGTSVTTASVAAAAAIRRFMATPDFD